MISAFFFACRAANKETTDNSVIGGQCPPLLLVGPFQNFPVRHRFEHSEQRILCQLRAGQLWRADAAKKFRQT